MDVNTIAYIAFSFTGTIILCGMYGFFSYKNKMNDRYNYLYNRVESLYERFENICIDNHEQQLQEQRNHNTTAMAVPIVSGDYSIPILDPINYSTHPLMMLDENTYIKI